MRDANNNITYKYYDIVGNEITVPGNATIGTCA